MFAWARGATATTTPTTTVMLHVRRRGRIGLRGYRATRRKVNQTGSALDPSEPLGEGSRALAVQSEVLVIGSGIAGLTCALECATYGPVVIVTKDRLPESSSQYAQGGIASVWSPNDSFESHTEDTLVAGAGLCHRDVVETVVREGPDRVRDLIAFGTNFDVRGTGDLEDVQYDLSRDGGHSHRRILHALDATGHEIIRALSEAVRAAPNIVIREAHLAVDLLLDRRGDTPVCWGTYILDRATREVHRFVARATFL